MPTPIEIVLYGDDNEEVGRYQRRFVPLKMLKPALEMAQRLAESGIDLDGLATMRGLADMTDAAVDALAEMIDALAGLVVVVFGDRFTIEDMDDGSDTGEMMTVLHAIVGRVGTGAPAKNLRITLYGESPADDRALTRSFVPWKLLKRSTRLFKQLAKAGDIDALTLTPELIDELIALIIDVFGDRFTVEELLERADVGEVMTALYTVVGRARGQSANPTPPG